MKKLFIVFALLVIVAFPASAEEETKDVVARISYTVEFTDVARTGEYTGETTNGVPDGFGVFVATNDNGIQYHYIGEWKDGAMFGQGGTYWDSGTMHIGTYDKNNMIAGYLMNVGDFYEFVDSSPNDHGDYNVIYYRKDGSIFYEGCISMNADYHIGTFYTSDGKVFFSGEMGEGFDKSLVYIN